MLFIIYYLFFIFFYLLLLLLFLLFSSSHVWVIATIIIPTIILTLSRKDTCMKIEPTSQHSDPRAYGSVADLGVYTICPRVATICRYHMSLPDACTRVATTRLHSGRCHM